MTSLVGPYDTHPRDDVRRLTAAVPKDIADDLLMRMFPMYGFQDRMLATLIDWFYQQCLAAGIPPEFTQDNEARAIEILNQLKTNVKRN